MLEQSEIAEETMTTTITIRKAFVIGAVVIAVIAAFSQLVAETKPEAIEEARRDNKLLREDRDQTRDEILTLLKSHLDEVGSETPFTQKASNLLNTYQIKAEKSDKAIAILNQTKAEHKISGFKHLNAFLGSLGLPIFIFCLSIVLYIVNIFLRREKYSTVAGLIKLLSQSSFITSLTYIYWVLNPKKELHQAIYVISLLVLGYITYKIVAWILQKKFFNTRYITYDKFRNALAIIFDYIIIEVNDKFISEEQKVDFIKSYDDEIDKISEIIE